MRENHQELKKETARTESSWHKRNVIAWSGGVFAAIVLVCVSLACVTSCANSRDYKLVDSLPDGLVLVTSYPYKDWFYLGSKDGYSYWKNPADGKLYRHPAELKNPK